jgi:putative membrane-bound dehydrogenase-like protein
VLHRRRRVHLLVFCWLLTASLTRAADLKIPAVNDPQLELAIFAAEPEIVTPIGIAIDKRGRVFVVESHTHFPKPGYSGPKRDRVKVFEDTNHDGKPDRISVFAEELYHSMNLAFSPDGQLYLTHRNGVIILHDKDRDGISESRTTVLEMDTPGNFPHNGVGGIAFSTDGWLYVGMGENLGEKYTLRGSDGTSHSGGGEGGNVFRCRPDGSQLKLVATGFWNAFALAFDRAGYLFCGDNDPDSRPPCRLLDVVEGGDYGYKFRWGRSGLHPFTSWNGELPGTLPMVAGTGEAPSAILNCDLVRLPASYQGGLLVTSWGDHAIEFYKPTPFGASLRAERDVIIQGGEQFRPVGIDAAPDGAIFFTDWVDKDYSVHGKGRIWRIAAPGTNATIAANRLDKPAPNPARERMHRLHRSDSLKDRDDLVRALADDDPFIQSAAVTALAKAPFREMILAELQNKDPRIRLGAALALRRAGHENAVEVVSALLTDVDERVRRIALVWSGEEKLTALAGKLDGVLSSGLVSPALLQTYTAAVDILTRTKDPAADEAVRVTPASDKVQTVVMRLPDRHDDGAAIETLSKGGLVESTQLRIEAARVLAEIPGGKADGVLLSTALDTRNPDELRAEAVLAVAGRPASVLSKLKSLLKDPCEAVRIETARVFRPMATDPAIRAALQESLESFQNHPRVHPFVDQVEFALSRSATPLSQERVRQMKRPGSDEEWRMILASAGNVSSGRRIFFNPTTGCARCHRIEDHGGSIGPDLSVIALASNREKLMQSILHPSLDIAPQFVTYIIETKAGQSYSGLLAGEAANGLVTLITADGHGTVIPGGQIASRTSSDVSLMPEGLEDALTVDDFQDLLAFLLSRR